jgi:hypothetical protein
MESDNLHLYYLVMLSWLYIYRLQTKSNADADSISGIRDCPGAGTLQGFARALSRANWSIIRLDYLYYLVMLSWLYIYRLQTKSNADVLFNLGNIFLYGSIFLFSFRYGFKESEV